MQVDTLGKICLLFYGMSSQRLGFESTMEPSLPRFIVLSSQYLSSLWKSLGVGVSSSHTNHFCVWFTCHRDCRGIGCVAK